MFSHLLKSVTRIPHQIHSFHHLRHGMHLNLSSTSGGGGVLVLVSQEPQEGEMRGVSV